MAMQTVSLLPPRVPACCSSALKHTFRLQCTALPIGPARVPPRELHYSALSFDFDALALGINSGQRHAHGHPLLFMGIPGTYRSKHFKKTMHVVGGCASARCVPFSTGVCKGAADWRMWGGVRASKLLPIQFKKLSQTIRPFIREYLGLQGS